MKSVEKLMFGGHKQRETQQKRHSSKDRHLGQSYHKETEVDERSRILDKIVKATQKVCQDHRSGRYTDRGHGQSERAAHREME